MVSQELIELKVMYCGRGVISPLLANIYMNRFLKAWRGWKMEEKLGAKVQANKGDSGTGYRLELKLERQWPFEVQKLLMTMTMAEPSAQEEKKTPTPPCLEILGLDLPCTAAMVEDVFRERVRKAHPDRGGNVEEFVRLRRAYLEALDLLGASR